MSTRASVLAIVGLACAACGLEGRAHRSDADLVANFERHRSAFDRIARMAEEDRNLYRLDEDFFRGGEGADGVPVTPARWNEYRRLFGEADVPDGFRKPAGSPEMLMLFSSLQGFVTSGTAKGYAYSRQELGPLVASLDHPESGSHAQGARAFVRLADGWYLFFEWS
jgi:hypothetical protein